MLTDRRLASGNSPSAPPVGEFSFSRWERKQYWLRSCRYVVRATYDMVQRMIEDRIVERYERKQLEWLEWARRRL